MCDCAEGKIVTFDDNARPMSVIDGPQVHDCQYVKDRNSLIDRAVEIADDKYAASNVKWSREFMRAMDALYREKFTVD